MVLLPFPAATARAQGSAPPAVVAGIPANYDESRVGTYTLPDPLVLANGERVRDARAWTERRRPEIVRMFEEIQFGRAPGRPPDLRFHVHDAGTPALGGKAVRRQVTVYLAAVAASPVYELLGARGLRTTEMPAAGEPILNTLGYHMHAGGHGTIPSDWEVFLRFMRLRFAEGTRTPSS